jgi:hypothetical protein
MLFSTSVLKRAAVNVLKVLKDMFYYLHTQTYIRLGKYVWSIRMLLPRMLIKYCHV